jgi:transcriptional regulator with XRE-family HTH domain
MFCADVVTTLANVARNKDLPERVRLRTKELFDRERHKPRAYQCRTQAGLAKSLGIKPGTLSNALNGRDSHAIRLKHVDVIAEYFGVPPALLVTQPGNSLHELTPEESRLLTHWRDFPLDIQERVMSMFDYFAGLLPEEKEQRRWWVKVSRIRKPSDRRYIEQAIDDVLRAQRIERGGDAPPAGKGSFDATESAIRTRPDRRIR